jgi:hypothetical protein
MMRLFTEQRICSFPVAAYEGQLVCIHQEFKYKNKRPVVIHPNQ